jgi:putative transposase
VGHVFQGRFKAILVDHDNYFLDLCRYVELNPVRARMVARAADWLWSSYLAHTGEAPTPEWLDTAGLHGHLLGHAVRNAADAQRAAQHYAALVARAPDLQLWPEGLRQQIFLGDAQFVERMQALMATPRVDDRDIPKPQRRPAKPLSDWLAQAASREEGLYLAHVQGGLSMTEIAQGLGLSVSRVSRLIARVEAQGKS